MTTPPRRIVPGASYLAGTNLLRILHGVQCAGAA
jgi:hypothetical protein